MVEESTLKIECAKLQSDINLMEDDLSRLEESRRRADSQADVERSRLIEREKSAFDSRNASDIKAIEDACASMRSRVENYLDSIPELEAQEYIGKYEVKELEEKLSEFYPKSFLEKYVSSRPIEFDDESEAYVAYTTVERYVAQLRSTSISGSLFNGITSLLTKVCEQDGMFSKVCAGVVAGFTFTFVFAPFLFLTLFSVVGLASIVYGAAVSLLFRNLYSVKQFLNNTYDEDIFQDDKNNILEYVDAFLEETRDDYIADVKSREFKMNQSLLDDLSAKTEANKQRLDASILAKRQKLDMARDRAADLLRQLDEASKRKEELAKGAYAKFLGRIQWEHKWADSMLLDVTKDNRVIGCKWLRANTLYYSKSGDSLQTFLHLVAYQSLLRMHPSYANQVLIDYKYYGGKLVPFSKLLPAIFQLCAHAEDIEKKMARIGTDIRSRCDTILQSCESIESFNELMSSYGVGGESFVVVHIVGLSSITNELSMFFKNGPKVGYFFKIYLTSEELNKIGKDFPFEDFGEFVEVTDNVIPRTVSQVKRTIEQAS